MTARSRERGSHAGRTRTYGFPFSVPGLSGSGTPAAVKNAASGTLPRPATEGGPGNGPVPPTAPVPGAPGNGTAPSATLPGGTAPAPPAAGSAGRGSGSRHRKTGRGRFLPPKLPKGTRLVAGVVVLFGALGVGFADGGFGGEPSAEPTVQAFLINWQDGHYRDAAALTNGKTAQVSAQLAAAYTDLDATNQFFSMKSVTQHGSTATATFEASVSLAQAGQHWSYTGQFGLRSVDGNWVVDWAPSVINPALGPGDRLAVETSYAPRARVTDVNGQSLLTKSPTYRIGVYPGKLKNPRATADQFSQAATLDNQQVLGQIRSAPPTKFLSLLTLSPADFSALWPKLSKVPGLSFQQQADQLFSSPAPEVVGTVGTEHSPELRQEGAAYQPGMTVGQSGLEQTFQNTLIGTPTTTVEVVSADGHVTKQWVLSGGHAGTPVKTTLDSKQQSAAVSALAGESNSAEIVAIDTATGGIRALATQSAGSVPLPAGGPLNARVQPGMAFSIVSAAALLSAGVSTDHPLPCEPEADVGGVTFTYQPAAAAASSTFASDFANGCGTAFANMSRTLTAKQLNDAERAFGIGASWQLRLASFSGVAPMASSEAQVAAQATGAGSVLMSPAGMAAIAAEVASGTGRSPVLIPTDPSTTWKSSLSSNDRTQLQQLMRLAVANGSAHAADVPGTPVYGQAGVVQTGKDAYQSWFVGYRGTLAVAVLETGTTADQAAAALAGQFLKSAT